MCTPTNDNQLDNDDDEVQLVGFWRTSSGSAFAQEASTSSIEQLEIHDHPIVKRELIDTQRERQSPSDVKATQRSLSDKAPERAEHATNTNTLLHNLFSPKATFVDFECFNKISMQWHQSRFANKTLMTCIQTLSERQLRVVCDNVPSCAFRVDLQRMGGPGFTELFIASAHIVHSEPCNIQIPAASLHPPTRELGHLGTPQLPKKDTERVYKSFEEADSPFQVGQKYALSQNALKKALFEWLYEHYPDMTVQYRSYKSLNGLSIYFFCKPKGNQTYKFRVLFRSLPSGQGYKVALTTFSSASMRFSEAARLNPHADTSARSVPSSKASRRSDAHSERETHETDSQIVVEPEEKGDMPNNDCAMQGEDSPYKEKDEAYFTDEVEEQLRQQQAGRVESGTPANADLTHQPSVDTASAPSPTSSVASSNPLALFPRNKNDATEPLPDHDDAQDYFANMGIHQSICERLELHGIKRRGQLKEMGIGELDFDGVCEVVCTKEPFAIGDPSRVAAHLAKKRCYWDESQGSLTSKS